MNTSFERYLNKELSFDNLMHQVNSVREERDSIALGLSLSELDILKRLGQGAMDQIMEARQHKAEIIQKWKDFFRTEIAENHRRNTVKLKHLKEFNQNPFLDNYKANFLLGDNSPKSRATALGSEYLFV